MTKSMFYDIFDREILPFIDEIQQNNRLVRKKDIEVCKEEIFSEYNVSFFTTQGRMWKLATLQHATRATSRGRHGRC